MKVWLVGVYDAEGNEVEFVCSTHEKALEKFHELRKGLIEQYRESILLNDDTKDRDIDMSCFNKMYEKMIDRLQEEDPSLIDNYPHDTPYVSEREVIE